MTSPKKSRKTYSAEFKEEALKLELRMQRENLTFMNPSSMRGEALHKRKRQHHSEKTI